MHPVYPEDVIEMMENFNGSALMHETRMMMPGVLPSPTKERGAKLLYRKDFDAVLLPCRKSRGWLIDA